ncbi:interleukin-22 [Alosa sapidissima]|uniref:interleukin-22 n=1 Tax=Alosa sapidissima TaxID=34773 RepID=UPI001C0A34AD|nr:interleukin-22 [Alosa sapidissima]XP_041936018.1 interleukin-22 [Alosa sapidissima]
MKSFLVLAFVVCCAVWGDTASLLTRHKHCSQPLDNSATWNNIIDVAQHAQGLDKNHMTRILPKMPEKEFKENDSCCVHANILDYYLKNVLTDALPTNDHHSRLPIVKEELHRVRRDLVTNANCDLNKYDVYKYNKTFRKNFLATGVDATIKAISEMDILFHYLYESCGKERCT